MISFLKLQVRDPIAVSRCYQQWNQEIRTEARAPADLVRRVTGENYSSWQQAVGTRPASPWNPEVSQSLASNSRALNAFNALASYVNNHLGVGAFNESALSNDLNSFRNALRTFFQAAGNLNATLGQFESNLEQVVNRMNTSALCVANPQYACCLNARTLSNEFSSVRRVSDSRDAGSVAPVDASVVDASVVDASLPPADVSRVQDVVLPSIDAGLPRVDANVRDVPVADVYVAPPRDSGVPLRDAGAARPDVDLFALMALIGRRDAGQSVGIGSGTPVNNGPRVGGGQATVVMGDPTQGGTNVDFGNGRPTVTQVAATNSPTVSQVNSYLTINNRIAPVRIEMEVQTILSEQIRRATASNPRLSGKVFSATFVLRYDAANMPVAVRVESSDFANDDVIRQALERAFRGVSLPVYNARPRGEGRSAFPVFINQRIDFSFR